MRKSSRETGSGLWAQARIATMAGGGGVPYGAIEDGALVVRDGIVAWVGPADDVPAHLSDGLEVHRLGGRWITPGLIDCHTHLVYAGNRSREFEMRLSGVGYEEIARRGGGILATVNATRCASEQSLLDAARERAAGLMAEGVTTLEVKSGYGLDRDTELKMLRVARALGAVAPMDVRSTFLGAHALPPEFAGRSDDYVEFICTQVMPVVAKLRLADAVDAFCERIAFSPAQVEHVFQCARSLGLPVKLHAEQLSDSGGAVLAARFRALSADHLEYAGEPAVSAMADAGTVAVLLPGAFYFLRETRKPPVELLRAYRVPMALATDSNPGSSPTGSLLLMLNMACTLFGLTPEEALAGVTRHAAMALGIDTCGTLETGRQADFVIWDIDHPAELAYRFGHNPCHAVVKAGRTVVQPFAG